MRFIGDVDKAWQIESRVIFELERILYSNSSSFHDKLRALRAYEKVKKNQIVPISILDKTKQTFVAEIRRRQDNYLAVLNQGRSLIGVNSNYRIAIIHMMAEVWHLYALSFAHLGDVERSILEYNLILEQPLNKKWKAFCKFELASLHRRRGDDRQAADWLEKIIKDHPSLPGWSACAHHGLAEYYKTAGDLTSAARELEVIIQEYSATAWAEIAKTELNELKSPTADE